LQKDVLRKRAGSVCLARSLLSGFRTGAILELDDRAKLEEFIRAKSVDLAIPPVKEDETMFEYVVCL